MRIGGQRVGTGQSCCGAPWSVPTPVEIHRARHSNERLPRDESLGMTETRQVVKGPGGFVERGECGGAVRASSDTESPCRRGPPPDRPGDVNLFLSTRLSRLRNFAGSTRSRPAPGNHRETQATVPIVTRGGGEGGGSCPVAPTPVSGAELPSVRGRHPTKPLPATFWPVTDQSSRRAGLGPAHLGLEVCRVQLGCFPVHDSTRATKALVDQPTAFDVNTARVSGEGASREERPLCEFPTASQTRAGRGVGDPTGETTLAESLCRQRSQFHGTSRGDGCASTSEKRWAGLPSTSESCGTWPRRISTRWYWRRIETRVSQGRRMVDWISRISSSFSRNFVADGVGSSLLGPEEP